MTYIKAVLGAVKQPANHWLRFNIRGQKLSAVSPELEALSCTQSQL